MVLHRLRSLFYTPDTDDPVRVERTIARLRVALAASALLAISVDPSQPARYAPVAYSILGSYLLVALALLLARPETSRFARPFALTSHAIDIVAGAAATLFTEGPNSPFFVFLTFPLLTAAYRWATTETLMSAAAALLALGAEAVLVQSTLPFSSGVVFGEFTPNRLIVRAAYLVISGVAVGYLAGKEKQRRRESVAVAELIRGARIEAGLAGTLYSLLSAIGKTFDARQALLVVQEAGTPRTYLLDARTNWRSTQSTVTSSELTERERDAYLFPSPGHSWYSVDLSPLEGHSVTALDDEGRLLEDAYLRLPRSFTELHRCRSILAVTVGIDTGWSGRLLLLDPQVGLDREESVRFAQRLVRDIGPAVRQTSVIHRLRRRAERIERLRLARELHDGPIQTLSAAALQIELMRRRTTADPALSHDLEALESLLRDEIANIRDMTQEMRLGLLETDSPDLVRELAEIVDRFARQQPIHAQFVSDEAFVFVSALVRHELLRVTHEALVNVRKHSGATEALVWLRVFGDRLILSIEDNGRGFAFDGRLSHRDLEQRRVGPVVVRERIATIGGELAVDSRPGHGARLEFRVPLSPATAHALRHR